jgi:L-amino acid N-acyltransferase YncA
MIATNDISVKPHMTTVPTGPMRPGDWDEIKAIYLEGIATGHATFETEAASWETWDRTHLSFARLVTREKDSVSGWAALSPVSSRKVYAGVAEVSVYVAAAHRGQGIGRALLESLIVESERNGIWTLQAAVFPENEATLALHKRCGFREVGRRERISKLNGVWRDTVLLERRSQLTGKD